MLNSNLIPMNTKSNNNTRRLITEIRVMSPRLAGMDIAHMQLNKWNANTQQRIANGHRGVRVGARVDHDSVDLAARGLDAIDDCALMVGLEGIESAVMAGGNRAAVGLDIREGGAAVDVRFASAQEVEVGAVNEED